MNMKLSKEAQAALPQEFLKRMQELLQEEYQDFLAAYEKERSYGLRFNPLKTDKAAFLERMPFSLKPVAWAEEGFYYRPEEQPGKHVYHEAGAYYIQEPSAMSAVEALAPAPGERILDLCAAPGGKSTQIAGKMMGKGLLVANEIIPDRARILSQNIERMGIFNAVVCNEQPERMAEFFPAFFDKILVDAPCSGEGMFRKDETAIGEWSMERVKMCRDRQLSILEQAASMLRPGGALVYSTCTFSVEENEAVISTFLHAHEEFSIEKTGLEKFFGQPLARQKNAWLENPPEGIENTVRLWPHKIEGEGHFFAKLRKAGSLYTEPSGRKKERKAAGVGIDGIEICRAFLQKELGVSGKILERFDEDGVFLPFGGHMYLIPRQMIALTGLKVVRPGLHLGTMKKNRFEPSYALAMYLSPDAVRQHYEMTEIQTKSYLRGETFACDAGLRGWTLLTMNGYTFGFGKAGNGQMKNHYPKGLRKDYSGNCETLYSRP